MAILRKNKTEKYTVIPNGIFWDENLSLKAIGLLTTLLSLPDNWEFSENGLCAKFKKDGQTSIRSALKELTDAGYLKRTRLRDEKNRITAVEWVISETPYFENHSMENASLENQPQISTNQSSTKEQNTNSALPSGNDELPYGQGAKTQHAALQENLEKQEEPEDAHANANLTKGMQGKSMTFNVDEVFDQMWDAYPCKKGKSSVKPAQRKKLAKIGVDAILLAIDAYKAEKGADEWRQWQNGSTFFNTTYADFLSDEKASVPHDNPDAEESSDPYSQYE